MKFFTTDNGIKIPVDIDRYLLPMLTSTSKNTKYWESPPPGPIQEAYIGEKILQVHQFLSISKSLNVDLDNMKLLDIGAGNGIVPKLLLEFSKIKEVVCADPYERNSHISTWQPELDNDTFLKVYNLIINLNSKKLNFSDYRHLVKETAAANTFIPEDFYFDKGDEKKTFGYFKIDAHNLSKTNSKFDLIYCKAIEHIPEWKKMFKSISDVSKKGTLLYFKHRSFFSYLGPHRFSSVGTPWGHVLLTDKEFKRYAFEFHSDRAEKLVENYFSGLSWPRYSMSDFTRIAQQNNFSLHSVKIETPSYISKISSFPNEIDNFWDLIYENYPRLNAEELFSSMYHIVLKKL